MLIKYEGLFILEPAEEDSIKGLLEKLQKEIEAEGGSIETVQKMGNRPLARGSGNRSAGYYVNYIFEAPPKAIAALDAKLHLGQDVFRWHFTRATSDLNPSKIQDPEPSRSV